MKAKVFYMILYLHVVGRSGLGLISTNIKRVQMTFWHKICGFVKKDEEMTRK